MEIKEENTMFGWMGKILRIDLSTGKARVEDLDKEMARRYLGGRGLGAYFLRREVDPGTDPLGPENKMIFAAGPLTGTTAPTPGRFSLTTRSPLTGTIFDSNAGGTWGVIFKRCGFDAMIVSGRADRPVYIELKGAEISVKDAGELWGQDTKTTVKKLTESLGAGSSALAIGPAGERQVKLASICVDGHRALGRGGVGAVMGSKNLKAIVVKGAQPPAVADEESFKFVCYEANKWLKASPITSIGLPTFGTSMLVNLMNEYGVLPTRNFQENRFEGANDVSGEAMADEIFVKRSACYGCSIACGRRVKDSRGQEVEGPEYETLWSFGAACGVSDLARVVEANLLCNRLGLDTISMGSTIACAMELGSKGLLDIDARFGDADAMLRLIRSTAYRDGIGDLLAEGSARLAEKAGAPELAMQVKGLEMSAYDPRGMKAQGLAFATSNRGACHLRANMLGPEILGLPKRVDRRATHGKAGLLIVLQHSNAVLDSLVLCKFSSFALGDEFYARLLSAATGVEYKVQDLQLIGERIWNLERFYNLKAGLTGADDRLPARLTQESARVGEKDEVVDLKPMLAEYYRFRGWDEQGVPSPAKLAQLGLEG